MSWRPADDYSRHTDRTAATVSALAGLLESLGAAERRATDWRDGSHQTAASLDEKFSGGETASAPERHVANTVRRTSAVWTSRDAPWTDGALRELAARVTALHRAHLDLASTVARILAEPNPDALGRQTQLVPCANPACDEMLDPAKGEVHSGRCEPCAEHRRTNALRDRTVAQIREAHGNVGAGICDHPDCDTVCTGDRTDRLRTDPTDPDRRLCDRHYKQTARSNT